MSPHVMTVIVSPADDPLTPPVSPINTTHSCIDPLFRLWKLFNMSKESSPPDPFSRYRPRANALSMTAGLRSLQAPIKRSSSVVIKYMEDGPQMPLCEAESYFTNCISKAFLVKEGDYKERRGSIAKGE